MKTKLITITLVSLVAVLVMVPFFTAWAYFSDTESSLFIFSTSDFSSSQHLSEPEQPSSTTTAVALSAGTVDIAVNGQNPWAETYEFTSMTPGLWGETDINIANIGNNPVTYKISAEWDSSSSPSSQYLFDALQVEIFDARGNLITSVDQFLKDLDTPSHFLAASGEELLKFKVKLRDDAGTEYQNLITKFNLIIIATQIIDRNALIVEFEGAPLFNEANFSPGQNVTRWVKVTNNSGQIQRIAIEAINTSEPYQLGDVLNLEIKEGGIVRYNNALSSFFSGGENYLSDLANGATTQYDLIISFYPEASNDFQGKSLSFDILVGFQGTEGGLLPGAGGGLPSGLIIQDESIRTTGISETSVTITWLTTYMSTSQVIYAAEGEPHTLDLTDNTGTPPKYGYAHTTPEYDVSSRVTVHSVTISGLTPGTTYYYRTISYVSISSPASGYFSDAEVSSDNTFTAGTLDFSLSSASDFSSEVEPDQSAVRTISVLNNGSLGFQYNIRADNFNGSLCDYLNLEANLDVGSPEYSGSLKDFSYNAGEFFSPEDWEFIADLTSNDFALEGATCTFDFIYSGTQIGSAGFSDTETFSNIVTAGIWEVEKPPENQPPIASFVFSNNNPKAGEEIFLDASESKDPDGGKIVYYCWDFGDGMHGCTESPIIFYYWKTPNPVKGYNVRLEVTDDEQSTGEKLNNIKVAEGPWEPPWAYWFKPKIDREEINKIKSALDLPEYFIIPESIPKSDIPEWHEYCFHSCLYSLDYSIDECELFCNDLELGAILNKAVLNKEIINKEIDPKEKRLTYRTHIVDTIQDMKLIDAIDLRIFKAPDEINAYFDNMAEVNVWAEWTELIAKFSFQGLLKLLLESLGEVNYGGPIIKTLLMIPDLCKADISLKFLDELSYRRAVWFYFVARNIGEDSDSALGWTPLSEYEKNGVKNRLETLWIEYSPGMLKDSKGLSEEFKGEIKKDLRRILTWAYEKYKFEPLYEEIRLSSPGELRVYDSQGRVTGLVNGEIKEEIPNSTYDAENETVIIFDPFDTYRYEIVGTETGTYGLEITSVESGKAISFTVTDIPTTVGQNHQYTIDWGALSQGENGVTVNIDLEGDGIFDQTVTADNDLTYDEFILQTETIIDFDPDTLNLNSNGKFITTYIELPEGYNVNQIDIPSIMLIILNGSVPALSKPTEIGDYDNDGIPDLMVKFDRSEVQAILSPGEGVPVTITGKVFYNGNYIDFKGSDIIRVVDPGGSKK